jgi:hypothetical protein
MELVTKIDSIMQEIQKDRGKPKNNATAKNDNFSDDYCQNNDNFSYDGSGDTNKCKHDKWDGFGFTNSCNNNCSSSIESNH